MSDKVMKLKLNKAFNNEKLEKENYNGKYFF